MKSTRTWSLAGGRSCRRRPSRSENVRSWRSGGSRRPSRSPAGASGGSRSTTPSGRPRGTPTARRSPRSLKFAETSSRRDGRERRRNAAREKRNRVSTFLVPAQGRRVVPNPLGHRTPLDVGARGLDALPGRRAGRALARARVIRRGPRTHAAFGERARAQRVDARGTTQRRARLTRRRARSGHVFAGRAAIFFGREDPSRCRGSARRTPPRTRLAGRVGRRGVVPARTDPRGDESPSAARSRYVLVRLSAPLSEELRDGQAFATRLLEEEGVFVPRPARGPVFARNPSKEGRSSFRSTPDAASRPGLTGRVLRRARRRPPRHVRLGKNHGRGRGARRRLCQKSPAVRRPVTAVRRATRLLSSALLPFPFSPVLRRARRDASSNSPLSPKRRPRRRWRPSRGSTRPADPFPFERSEPPGGAGRGVRTSRNS